MTTLTQDHERDRQPTWTVQTVFDPDGGGKDFAYTIGLDDLGHPELHVWGRPGLGDDPGDDWMLSPHDRCRVLNQLAWLLIDGELQVGSEVTREYDDGHAVVRFRIDPPGDIEELEAFGVAAGALVLPVRWSLTRAPEGPPRALSQTEQQAARALRRQILATVDRRSIAPVGWGLDGRAGHARDQTFGPLTKVVVARAAQLWQANPTEMNCFLRAAAAVDAGSSLTFPVSMAVHAARRSGRREELVRLRDAVHDLLDELTEGAAYQRWWREIEESLWGEEIMRDLELAGRAGRSDKALLHGVVEACLTAEAVADVLESKWLMHARGPWLAELAKATDLPGPEWSASTEVLDIVVGLLRPLSLTQLGGVARLHRWASDGVVEGWDDYANVTARLRGWALVGPAGCPWAGTLDQLPAWRGMVEGILPAGTKVDLRPLPELHEWASLITSALCHRGRLTSEDVRQLVDPYVELLPELERVLNEPIVGSSTAT